GRRNVRAVVGGYHYLSPSIRKRLTAPRHHVGNCGQAVVLSFIRKDAANIASFRKNLRTELVLNADRKLIGTVGLEVRIDRFSRSGGDVVEPGIPRLRKVRARIR